MKMTDQIQIRPDEYNPRAGWGPEDFRAELAQLESEDAMFLHQSAHQLSPADQEAARAFIERTRGPEPTDLDALG